jgi:ribonuclease P protein component
VLPAAHRLRLARDITRVYRRGRYGTGNFLSIKAMKNSRPESRAAFVVSKKVSKKAVIRNRIRRRLAEILRNDWETVALGYDIVVTVHQDISMTTTDELKLGLITALTKSGCRAL